MSSVTLDGYISISNHALNALQDDALLPICTACGTQYPMSVDSCLICQDPRQFVNPAGQSWTNLAELGQSRKHKILRDEEDDRISFIQTEPGFGISQTPTLIETGDGIYIWDCVAFLSPHLIAYLSERPQPLKAIAISHPHFFSTSLTWARALRVPLYLCEDDQVWYQRFEDIKESDDIRWFKDTVELGPRVSVVQCGGHFPGSCILYWDRLGEPAPPKDNLPSKPTPVSGIIFCADTIMVQPTQTDFTFVWSAPNMIPLRPINVLAVQRRIEHLSFSQATSSWPNRFIRQDAKEILRRSVSTHLNACGWKMDDRSGYLIPR